jgi:thiol:disulfide interchange protein
MKKKCMFIKYLTLGVILLFTGCASLGPVYQKVEKSDAEIRNEIKEACKKAKETDKFVLLDFYGSFCFWCIDMDKALQHPEVKKELTRFVYLKIDVGEFVRHGEIMKQYVDKLSVPALVILDSDGNKIVHLDADLNEDRVKKVNDPYRLAEALRKYANKKQ